MKIRLNDEQARAAQQLDGPVLVTAGAGSGKTRMLTERFANAVVPGRLAGWTAVDPGSVVAITYTEKAAGEIAERVRQEMCGATEGRLGGREDLWISTIHGFCSRLLRRNPFEAGVDPLFTVADTLEAGRLRERAFREALISLDADDGRIRDLLDAYQEDAIFSATIEIARQLAVAGLGVESIRLETAPSVGELLAEAQALLGDGTSVCDIDYRGASTTHIEHSELCHDLLLECAEIASLDHSEAGTLERVLSMAQRYTPIRPLAAFKDLRDEMTARRGLLVAHVVTALGSGHETTLVDLVGAYLTAYGQQKRSAGLLDFEDLQTHAVRLLDDRPEIAARYRKRFEVVMIDEFQDTDALQLRLVEHVAGENLCTVGDEMQAIYGFRGADVAVYRRHRKSMTAAGALSAELAVNYRSDRQILDFVNTVFSSEFYDKNRALPLRAAPDGRGAQRLDEVLGTDPRVEVLVVDAGKEGIAVAREREAAEIAQRLAELRKRGMDPGDVAVLLRAYRDAHLYADALAVRGIPAVIVGGGRFFDLAETAIMRALTRAIANVSDETALGALLVSDFVPLTDQALLLLRMEDSERRRPLWELVCSETEQLDPPDAQALQRLRSVLESARARVGREPLEDVLLRAVEESGYDLRLLGRGNMGRDAFANVLKFARRASEFEQGDGSGPAGFSAYLDDKERMGDIEAPDTAADEGGSSVRIMSIHASKGLEFPVVVVPDIGRQSPGNSRIVRTARTSAQLRIALKTPKRDDGGEKPPNSEWFCEFDAADAAAEQEGRERVFYVALTRARDLLLVSGCGALNPSTRPPAKDDLVKLVRVLGHDVPIGEPRDEQITVGEGECRFRVVQLGAESAAVPTKPASADAPPPAYGEPLAIPQNRGWLPKTVSYTQLSEFERCPRQFRIRRVLGIAPPAAIASGQPQPKRLGTALHAVLRLVSADGEPPGEARIGAIARYFELDAEECSRLSSAMQGYCGSEVASRAVSAEVVMREAPFSVAAGDGAFVVAGSIDLYARSGDTALIVDYKSGTSGESAELPDRYRLQADCYAFAALRDGCCDIEVVFVRPEVTVDGRMEQISFSFDEQDAVRIEAELMSRYRQIERSAFDPTPGPACANCDVPRGLCEHRLGDDRAQERRSR